MEKLSRDVSELVAIPGGVRGRGRTGIGMNAKSYQFVRKDVHIEMLEHAQPHMIIRQLAQPIIVMSMLS